MSVPPRVSYLNRLGRLQSNEERLEELILLMQALERSLPASTFVHLLTAFRDRISTYLETGRWA